VSNCIEGNKTSSNSRCCWCAQYSGQDT